MQNSFDPSQGSGSYLGLLKRLTIRVQAGQTEARVLELIHHAFEAELAEERLVLSRAEIARLARQVTRAVLAQMVAGIDAQRSDQLPQ